MMVGRVGVMGYRGDVQEGHEKPAVTLCSLPLTAL